MGDKFSYYDFIANVVPPTFLIWGISNTPLWAYFTPISKVNDFVAGAIFVVMLYVLGLLLQFFSKITIGWFLKTCIWNGTYLSYLFLLKEYNFCRDPMRLAILKWAKDNLEIDHSQLVALDKEDTDSSRELSNLIYRRADAFTKDRSLAQKAHVQNDRFSLYRNLASVALLLLAIFLWYFAQEPAFRIAKNYLLLGFLTACLGVFVYRAKQSAFLYVQGIFWALGKERS